MQICVYNNETEMNILPTAGKSYCATFFSSSIPDLSLMLIKHTKQGEYIFKRPYLSIIQLLNDIQSLILFILKNNQSYIP